LAVKVFPEAGANL